MPAASTLLRQPLHKTIDRDHVVAVVAQRRRRDGQLELARARQVVDRFLHHRSFQRRLVLEIRQQLEHGAGIEQRAGEAMRTHLARLLQHVDVVLGERRVGMLGVVLVDQLRQAQRTGHAGGASADDDHVRFHRRTLNVRKWFTKYDHAMPFLNETTAELTFRIVTHTSATCKVSALLS